MSKLMISGFEIHSGLLSRKVQEQIRDDIRKVVEVAPLTRYKTGRGKQMSVRMSAAGALGWMSDARGYSYVGQNDAGQAWPDIPDSVLQVWRDVAEHDDQPNSCLVNFYDPQARMGLHRDDTEGRYDAPVVSISLGDDGLFRMGGLERSDKTSSHWLKSGDVVVMGGQARLAHHGIDRIRPGTSTLLSSNGRLNLTLRLVKTSDQV